MQTYNKEPILVLWDLVKDLKNDIPIYKEIMHEESRDVPQSYILLRSQVADTNKSFGDGKSLIRAADCDIILTSKGYADDTTDLHNVNKIKIRNKLKEEGITFNEFNLGYDSANKNTQHTFSLEVMYIV